MGYYKKIEGKDIYLASINLDDAEQYMGWVNDSDVVFEGYKREKIASVEDARNELNDMAVKNVFAVVDKNTNQFLGLTGNESRN